MKSLFIIIIALLFAGWVGLSMHHHPGIVIISVAKWRVDLPLWLFVLASVISFVILYYFMRLLAVIFNAADRFTHFVSRYSKKRAQKLTKRGQVALAEGNWAKAMHLLSSSAPKSDLPWLNYISAARAAQELGKEESRDKFLKLAHEQTSDTDVAIDLTQAELQYEHGQYEQSLATLKQLRNKAPFHPYVLKLLQNIYLRLKAWEPLLSLLPILKKNRILSKEQLNQLECTVWKEMFIHDPEKSFDDLQKLWDSMPKNLHLESQFAICYAKALQKQNRHIESEEVIKSALKHKWSEELIELYGFVHHPNPQKLLSQAEEWLHSHPTSPNLLLSLGRLCAQQQLWGKAQRYFEASLSLAQRPDTYAELGILLEKINKPELGAQYFKKGLLMFLNN